MASAKRKYEEDDFGSDEDRHGASSGRSGRVRKKSAKVIEMEEAEELEKLEKKQWKKEQKAASKKSKTIKAQLMISEVTPPSSSLQTDPLVIDVKEEKSQSDSLSAELSISSPPKSQSKKSKKTVAASLAFAEQDIKVEGEPALTMTTPPHDISFEEPAIISEKPGRKKKSESPRKKKEKVASPDVSNSLSPELLAHLSKEQPQSPPNLGLLMKTEKVKKEKKVKTVTIALPPDESDFKSEEEDGLDEHIDEGEEEEELEEHEEEEDEQMQYVNTAVMGQKVLTSKEKKAGKGKKKEKKEIKEDEKPRKKRGPTAYMLWCNSRRPKLVEDNPGIDFATISKKLGEIWQSIPEKEKMSWKRKAKKVATKGSSMINTGKAKAASTLLNKGNHQPVSQYPPGSLGSQLAAARQLPPGKIQFNRVQLTEDPITPQKVNVAVTPVDAAAHLKLLGESLSIIGARLQEHQGKIAVQGSFSVLLDSLLCALGPLVALTNQVPELDGADPSVHSDTLDNIAYVMPGIG